MDNKQYSMDCKLYTKRKTENLLSASVVSVEKFSLCGYTLT